MSFVRPAFDDVSEYAREIGYLGFNAQKFIDYYDMVGWKVSGRTPMKDWKAAVRYWRSNDKDRATMHTRLSLGALQIQLEKTEQEIGEILRPGGCAFNKMPTGEKKIRYEFLLRQRAAIRLQIEGAV